MKIITGNEFDINSRGSVVTVGGFDGIHIGHQALIDEVVRCARWRDYNAVLLTFETHPRIALGREKGPFLLSPIEEKVEILRAFDLDYAIFLTPDKELLNTDREEFVKKFLIEKLHTRRLILGFNHHFGKGRAGSAVYLARTIEKWNFSLTVFPPVYVEGEIVSSSKIRELLRAGELERANKMLGRPYSLIGEVVEGLKLGRKLGAPTANLKVHPYKLLPANGVYAVKVWLGNEMFKGVASVGVRPTINGKHLLTEVHIFDFDREIYGSTLKVEFLKFIRPEKKFSGLEELKSAISRDIETVKEFFIQHP